MVKVFFVDDDANLLSGLKRSLRPFSKDFDLFFYNSAEDALLNLNEERPDVIVTDYKMPGKNGIELLEDVRKLCPHSGRIVMSGHYDLFEEALGDLIHEILPKPCNPEELLASINKLIDEKKS